MTNPANPTNESTEVHSGFDIPTQEDEAKRREQEEKDAAKAQKKAEKEAKKDAE